MGSESSKSTKKNDGETRDSETVNYDRLLGKGEQPHEVLIEKLVNKLPDLMERANKDKNDFATFYHEIWKPDRETLKTVLLDVDKEMEVLVKLTEHWIAVKIAWLVSKVLLLFAVLLFGLMFINLFVVLSLTADIVYYGLDVQRKTALASAKRLVPIFHRDINNTDTLKEKFLKARYSYLALCREIKQFKSNITGPGFGNDLSPVVLRFFNTVKTKNPSESESDMAAVLDAFLSLISDFNASFKYTGIKKNSCHEYMDLCSRVGECISDLMNGLKIVSREVEFSNMSTLMLDIAMTDEPRFVVSKIATAVKTLKEEGMTFTKNMPNHCSLKKR